MHRFAFRKGLLLLKAVTLMFALVAIATRSTGAMGIELQLGTSTDASHALPQTNSNSAVPNQQAGDQANRTGLRLVITIDKTKQEMTVTVDGALQYQWPVSTGRFGYSTPSGRYTPSSINKIWYSKEWNNAPMPHAIFFMKDGHAIHGSYDVKALGRPVSHGCVRLSPQNAATLYALVEKNGLENTQIILTGVTQGGESKEPDWSPGIADQVQSDAEAEIAITRQLLQSDSGATGTTRVDH
jgi:lipoprotein-anchoring transpeptidase ErfK/SrfK